MVPAIIFLVPLVFGAEFRPAVVVSLIVLIGSHFVNLGYVLTNALTAQQRGRLLTAAHSIGAVAGLTAGAALCRLWNGGGLALGMAFGYCVTVMVCVIGSRVTLISLTPTWTDLRRVIRLLAGSKEEG
jgi:O-antigen/teichoic acid export membrane protein